MNSTEITSLDVRVVDDGIGGASLGAGSGLLGLKDRVEALGGQFVLRNKRGGGTSVSARLPLAAPSSPDE
jgi:signal transduction histidine kinase